MEDVNSIPVEDFKRGLCVFNEQRISSRFKTRYVTNGFVQIFGEDYDEIIAPVAKQATLRALLTVARKRGLSVNHFDIKTAFANGQLIADMYTKQWDGFIVKEKERLVCILKKRIC